jgi:hypothetical protein
MPAWLGTPCSTSSPSSVPPARGASVMRSFASDEARETVISPSPASGHGVELAGRSAWWGSVNTDTARGLRDGQTTRRLLRVDAVPGR